MDRQRRESRSARRGHDGRRREEVVALSLPAVNRGARATAVRAIVLMGFSLPISTALDNILLGVVLIAFLLSGRYREKLGSIVRNPAALALAGLFALLAFGILYGEAPFADRLKYLYKYSDLLLAALMVSLLADGRVGGRALLAFGAAMVLTLVLSLLLASGLLPAAKWLHGNPANAVVFKLQITHNLLMAIAAFLFASVAIREPVAWRRRVLHGLALAAYIDVFFLVVGRTGQVALVVLTPYFFWRHFGWRGFLAGVLLSATTVIAAWHWSPAFSDRLVLTAAEYQHSQTEQLAEKSNSVGQRMEWYRNTVRLVMERPLLGHGTGGFPRAYADFITAPGASRPAHPHNQYLMMAAENGLVGLVAFIAVLIWLWWMTRRIPALLQQDLARGFLITFSIGCMFNSLLLDHVEGLLFAWMLALTFAGTDVGGRTHSDVGVPGRLS